MAHILAGLRTALVMFIASVVGIAGFLYATDRARNDHGRVSRSAPTVDGGDAPTPAAVPSSETAGTPMTMSKHCPAGTPQAGVTAAQLNAAMQAFRDPGWRWADGGASARLSDGRTMWLFGDTGKAATPERSSTMVANSMLISTGACFERVGTADDGPVLPDKRATPAKPVSVSWPTSVLVVPHKGWDEVLVFAVRVNRRGSFWGFDLMGSNLTRFVVPAGGTPRRMPTVRLTADVADETTISWGAASVTAGGTVYLYGTRRVGDNFGRSLYVARVPLARVADADAWEYRAADGWGEEAYAKPIVHAGEGVSHIVSAFRNNGRFVILSKVNGDLGDDIGVWTSAAPDGPFLLTSRLRRPYDVSPGNDTVRYMPLAHPEYGSGSDVLVSMSRNVPTPGNKAPAHMRRPEFFTVALPN